MDEIRRADELSTMPLFQHPDFTDSKESQSDDDVDGNLLKVADALLASEPLNLGHTSVSASPIKKQAPVVAKRQLKSEETLRFKTSFWSLLIDDKEHGPYTYLEVLTFLADDTIQETVSLKSLKTGWRPLYSHPEFAENVINKVIKSSPTLSQAQIKVRRKTSRYPVDAEVFVHKGGKKLRGKAIDLGVGGVGLYIINHEFRIGDLVQVDIPIAQKLPGVILDIRSQFVDTQGFELLRVAIHFEDLQLELAEQLESYLKINS